jgi:hypothetical protein
VVSRFEHLEELGELIGLFLGVDDLGAEWTAAEQPDWLRFVGSCVRRAVRSGTSGG